MEESIDDFDAVLQKLATYCKFGGTLEETLRDWFVCGLRHEPMPRWLLTEHALTYLVMCLWFTSKAPNVF